MEDLKVQTEVITEKETQDLVKDMAMAENISELSKSQNMSGKLIRKTQLNAVRLANKARRKGKHVVHPQRVGKFAKNAESFYAINWANYKPC